MDPIFLKPGQASPTDVDHVLIAQEVITGIVTVTGNVRDPLDGNRVTFLEPKTFWLVDAGKSEEAAMAYAEAWAADHGVTAAYVRRD